MQREWNWQLAGGKKGMEQIERWWGKEEALVEFVQISPWYDFSTLIHHSVSLHLLSSGRPSNLTLAEKTQGQTGVKLYCYVLYCFSGIQHILLWYLCPLNLVQKLNHQVYSRRDFTATAKMFLFQSFRDIWEVILRSWTVISFPSIMCKKLDTQTFQKSQNSERC